MIRGLLPLLAIACCGARTFASGPCPGADLFTNGAVHELHLEISHEGLSSLRESSREFVPATLREGTTVYTNVAVRLKGSIGSFREVDDKPALTLDFARFNGTGGFHGLRRIHLNNSVEDPSFCNELLGSEVFRAAGLPAPRVTHALVTLNERRLGVYVLKEGFTEDFLSCYFKRIGGELYEPGEGHDVNERLKRMNIEAPRQGRAMLEALGAAALEPDAAVRWPRLQATLDVDRFISFMTLEIMLGHRDGYCLARNNYRVYQDLDSGKILFFPHGMDQLLGNAEAPWRPHMAGRVAQAVMGAPEGARLYQERFRKLFLEQFDVEKLTSLVAAVAAKLKPFLSALEFEQLQQQCLVVRERIVQRHLNLQHQLTEPERTLLVFTNGVAHLGHWRKTDQADTGTMDQVAASDGTQTLHITAHAATAASWRTEVLLDAGHYRFMGRMKISGVKPLPFGKHQGAALRVVGSGDESPGKLDDSPWSNLYADFDVLRGPQEVELACELRARAGEAWFATDALTIVKTEPRPLPAK